MMDTYLYLKSEKPHIEDLTLTLTLTLPPARSEVICWHHFVDKWSRLKEICTGSPILVFCGLN